MADLVVVVGVVAFFAIAVGLVRGCDRIIGPDPEPQRTTPDVTPEVTS
jgi:hypothetical protein